MGTIGRRKGRLFRRRLSSVLFPRHAAGGDVSPLSPVRDRRHYQITFVERQDATPEAREEEGPEVQWEPFQVAEGVPELTYDLGVLGVATVTITGRACATMREHCADSNARGCETGGLLVGYREQSRVSIKARGGRKYHLVVTHAIPMSSPTSSSVSWSVNEDEWACAEEKLRAVYAPSGKVRLGWYHTHPDQGIFFSMRDRKAHELFDAPYEFALVIDPRNLDAGLFRWTWNPERSVTGPVSFSLANRRK